MMPVPRMARRRAVRSSPSTYHRLYRAGKGTETVDWACHANAGAVSPRYFVDGWYCLGVGVLGRSPENCATPYGSEQQAHPWPLCIARTACHPPTVRLHYSSPPSRYPKNALFLVRWYPLRSTSPRQSTENKRMFKVRRAPSDPNLVLLQPAPVRVQLCRYFGYDWSGSNHRGFGLGFLAVLGKTRCKKLGKRFTLSH